MRKALSVLAVLMLVASMLSAFPISVKACPLFIQEDAVFMTNISVTPLSHSFYECPESAPMFVLELSPTDQSYELSISFHINDTSVAVFFKVVYCDNSTVYRQAIPSSSLTIGWNTFTATLPRPSEGELHGVRIVGVAGHRDDDGLEPWAGVTDEGFGTQEGDWNQKMGDGYFQGRTAEDLHWFDYEVAYHFTLKTPGTPQHNPFIGSLTITPSKTTLSPGEAFTVTARYYRYSYCPSDYFKLLLAKPVSYTVYATREGLVGQTTANGHVIQPRDHFVALPSRKALSSLNGHEYEVRVTYGGRSVVAPVWDVGPWNTKDDYWNPSSEREMWKDLPQGTPEAQAAYQWDYNDGKDQFGRTVTNPAGIDLADGTFWDDLGMTENDWVTVEFLWMAGNVVEASRWAASYWQMVPYGWQTFTLTLTAPSTPGTYTLKAVGCSGHGTYDYYGVGWNDPRLDGDFRGHRPEEMSWSYFEIFAISSISVGLRRFDPKIDGFGFQNYGVQEGCIAYTFRQVYERIKNDPNRPLQIPLEILAWVAYQLLAKAHEGHCGGMCRTALYYYNNPEMIPSGFEKVYDIKEEDKAVVFNIIDYYQTEQFFHLDRDLKHILAFLGDEPTGLLATLDEIDWFKSQCQEGTPVCLTVLDPTRGLFWGHNVVAYDYEEDNDYMWIYFYNPNSPGNQNAYMCLEKEADKYTVFYDGTGFNCPRYYFDDAPTDRGWSDIIGYLFSTIMSEIKDQMESMFTRLLSVDLNSYAELHVYDFSRNHVGLDSSGNVELEFDALFYVDDVGTEHCLIPSPQAEGYCIELIGIGEGSYTLDIASIVEGTMIKEETISGQIVKGATYVYTVKFFEETVIVKPDPAAELAHLKEFINALPAKYFCQPKLTDYWKNALFSKINEVIAKINAGYFTDAINKLIYDIRAKMDGDSTAQDWITNPAAQVKLRTTIDHIVEGIRILRQNG